MRIVMSRRAYDDGDKKPQQDMRGTYLAGDDETEMRRRSRSAYEDGYADAMRRARMMRDEEDEMRRRSRSHHEEEPDDMRRRSRSMQDDYDEPDMRRGRPRSMHEDYDEPDMRRGRRSRSEYDMPMPWEKWGDDEPRKIGFSAHGGMEKMGKDVAEKGMAASKIIDPRLESILEDAVKVMENPPHTWEAYLKRKQYDGIARMEGKELMAALEEGKDAKDVKKELTHTIAALFMLMSK
ncbi:MAG: hypothetical protein HDQ88_11995 [Clostridia bacterium]|nr:hypothetical protein [Clostridia bacterium]